MNVTSTYFRTKIDKKEPNKVPSCWIPRLLVSLARQLEILTTDLKTTKTIGDRSLVLEIETSSNQVFDCLLEP